MHEIVLLMVKPKTDGGILTPPPPSWRPLVELFFLHLTQNLHIEGPSVKIAQFAIVKLLGSARRGKAGEIIRQNNRTNEAGSRVGEAPA